MILKCGEQFKHSKGFLENKSLNLSLAEQVNNHTRFLRQVGSHVGLKLYMILALDTFYEYNKLAEEKYRQREETLKTLCL